MDRGWVSRNSRASSWYGRRVITCDEPSDELLGPPYSSPVGGVVGSSSRHACDTANDQEDSSGDTITVPRRQTGPHRVGMGFVFLLVYSPHTSAGISDVVPSR